MFKKLMAVSVIAAMPAIAFAGGATVSGFADIMYSQDSKAFGASAEIDIANKMSDQVSVRIDTDLALSPAGGDSATLEQAYFAYTPVKAVTIIGGVFNNPIGWEADDAPDMLSISGGLVRGVLVDQTALYANNIAGIAVAGAVGPATITVAALNDIGGVADENSLAAVVNASPMKGLDLELGYVTQDAGAGNVLDINASYKVAGATVVLEYLKPEDAIKQVFGSLVNYEINPMVNVTGRFDLSTADDANDTETTQWLVAATFNAAKNLAILAEYKSITVGDADADNSATLEFIASF